MHGNTSHGNREIPWPPRYRKTWRPHREVQGRTPMMYDQGKSHNSILPKKSPNKAQAAEGTEERGLAKGKTLEHNTLRTQGREGRTTGRTLNGHETGNGSNGQGEAPTSCGQDSVHHVLERIRVGSSSRHYLRQEPYAGKPPVRVRAGGAGRPTSLPRSDETQERCPQSAQPPVRVIIAVACIVIRRQCSPHSSVYDMKGGERY